MHVSKSALASVFVIAVLLGATAAAQEPAPEPVAYSPFAVNAWAGIAYDLLHASGGTLSDSSSKAGAALGGDIGFRFTPSFALVALAEYAPIFSGDAFASNDYTLGGGFRFQSGLAQFILGGGYSSLNTPGGSAGGWGAKLIGTYPVLAGFGPYLQFGYNSFGVSGSTLSIFTANGGISFSY